MQCMLHRITHPDLFDPKLHRRTIRSARKICKDSSFFGENKMYTVNYSEIPKSCNPCGKDLVHHDAYHLVYHHNCKFCRFNKFKYRAESKKELHKIIKEEEKNYATVCPYCDNNLAEKPLRNKLIHYAHDKIPFKCNDCDKNFPLKQCKGLSWKCDSWWQCKT